MAVLLPILGLDAELPPGLSLGIFQRGVVGGCQLLSGIIEEEKIETRVTRILGDAEFPGDGRLRPSR